MKLFALAAILVFIALPWTVSAAPALHDPQPPNNTFVAGGTQTFSVNVTDDNLDTSAVALYIISLNAYDQGEDWDAHSLACTGGGSEWNCSKSLSFAIAGSDTVELFYFEANDTDDAIGNIGSSSVPLRFTLDRNKPDITFSSPANNTFVSSPTIKLTATDASSGIDNSTVQYSTDGSSWTTLPNASASSFEAAWNTTSFSNNQSITLQARATDKVGNSRTTSTKVTVDNQKPSLAVLSSLAGALAGSVQLQVNATDTHSGISLGSVAYSVSSAGGSLGCSGSNYTSTCSAVFDTTSLSDGNYTLAFSATDNAGNVNSTSVGIEIVNTQPSVSISEPAQGSFLKGTVLVKASVANADNAVSSVQLLIDKSGNVTTKQMACGNSFTVCNYSLDTTTFADGGYTLKANAVNNLGLDISASRTVTLDNTKPSVTITSPSALFVKGDFDIKAAISDAISVSTTSTFRINSFNGSLTCTPQTPSTLICSTTFDSKKLTNTNYTLEVFAEDTAGNTASHSITFKPDNRAPSLTFIRINPLSAVELSNFAFTIGLSDESNVKSAKLVASSNGVQKTIDLKKSEDVWVANISDVWIGASRFADYGTYDVSIIAYDENNNSETIQNAGTFFVGESKCGNDVCEIFENYCSCAQDCGGFTCDAGLAIECGSGIPKCVLPGVCGDSLCLGSETCDSCSQDCGRCEDLLKLDEEAGTSVFLNFGSKFIIPGIVVGIVLVAAIVIAIIVKGRLNKGIITDRQI